MLNKDNLENGLQHTAASVTLNPTKNTQVPKASLAMFVLILLPELAGGRPEGIWGGGLVVLENLGMHGSD